MTLSQETYMDKILHLANMSNYQSANIPMIPGWKPSTNSDLIDPTEFQHHTGCLNWLSIKTRPDITFTVMKLQQRNSTLTKHDLEAVFQVYQYLQTTQFSSIVLGMKANQKLLGYMDTSHADNIDGKSTSAYLYVMGGAPISWLTKKQDLVTPSSTVAEYIAYDPAIKEGLWLK